MFFILVFLPLVLTSVCLTSVASAQTESAHVRVVDLVSNAASLQVEFGSKGETHSLELGYKEVSDYQSLTPGVYQVTVTAPESRTPVLEVSYGLGIEGYYTLAVFGLTPAEPAPGAGFMDRLVQLFGGAAVSKKGYLPQSELLADDLGAGRKGAYLRVLHAAPLVDKLTLTGKREDKTRTFAPALGYAELSTLTPAQPGNYTFELLPQGSPVKVLEQHQRPPRRHTAHAVRGGQPHRRCAARGRHAEQPGRAGGLWRP